MLWLAAVAGRLGSETMLAVKVNPEYLSMFVQRHPKYAVKMPGNGKEWRTKKKPLADKPIQAHLSGQYSVATVSPWYPTFGVIDVDDAPREKVYSVLETIGLNEANSLVCASESPNSYHVYFRPSYNDKPPTVRLLNEVLRRWAIKKGVEIYPRAAKCFRLPFGPHDRPVLDDGETASMSLEQKLHWFGKLDEYDLAASPADMQTVLKLELPPMPVCSTTFKRGVEYMEYGLEAANTRHEVQFCVLYAMWRQNYNIDDAVNAAYHLITTKHNGFSKDIKRNPVKVLREIMRQASCIWNKYELANTYPDEAHNLNYGFLTKPDLQDIIRICEGNLPRIKFLGELVRYINPRQARGAVSVHTDRLQQWSSKTNYTKFLDELTKKGIVERSNKYIVGKAAKTIKLNWDFRSLEMAVKADKRTTDTLGSISNSFVPDELRECLKETGKERTAIIKTVKSIYGIKPGCEKTGNIYPFYFQGV